MNQFDKKHYYFDRTDPFKLGYFEEDFKMKWYDIVGEVLATILFVAVIVSLMVFNLQGVQHDTTSNSFKCIKNKWVYW